MHSANIGVFDEAVWQGHAVAAEFEARTAAEAQATFVRGMLDMPTLRDTRNPAELILSLIIHIVIVGAVILAPLLFTQVLDVHSFEAVFLVAPRPPAAPPPPAAQPLKVARPMARVLDISKLTAPAVIPAKIKIVADQAPPDLGAGVSGVVGGVPGGVLGGIIGGVTDNVKTIPPPPPPERRIVRVGGDVKPPVPISTPQPTYPPVAKAAHVEGLVVIDAIIDEEGNVVQARVVEGPPLLVAAALETVAKWKYQPTYLNGQAVSIRTHIQVMFRLH
ncbi:MAG: energy transducer TonB [Candidatus Acidiferrales bacterium]